MKYHDIVHWAENTIMIRDNNSRIVKIKLNKFQKNALHFLESASYKMALFESGRQTGKTTIMNIFLIYQMLKKNKDILYMARNNFYTIREIVANSGFQYIVNNSISTWGSPMSTIVSTTQTKILAIGLTTADSIRGRTIKNQIIIDDCKPSQTQDLIQSSIPVLAPSSSLIMLSSNAYPDEIVAKTSKFKNVGTPESPAFLYYL